MIKQDAGEVRFQFNSNSDNLSKYVGVVPQEIALYDELSAINNLKFWGSLYGLRGKKLSQAIDKNLDLVGLSDRKKILSGPIRGNEKKIKYCSCIVA